MSAVFFDIDTQIDFLYPAGALYVNFDDVRIEVVEAKK